MKSKAHLYLPWSVVAEWMASTSRQLPKVQPDRLRPRLASIEKLDGGCVLFRLIASNQRHGWSNHMLDRVNAPTLCHSRRQRKH
jgi:hypothetical protein